MMDRPVSNPGAEGENHARRMAAQPSARRGAGWTRQRLGLLGLTIVVALVHGWLLMGSPTDVALASQARTPFSPPTPARTLQARRVQAPEPVMPSPSARQAGARKVRVSLRSLPAPSGPGAAAPPIREARTRTRPPVAPAVAAVANGAATAPEWVASEPAASESLDQASAEPAAAPRLMPSPGAAPASAPDPGNRPAAATEMASAASAVSASAPAAGPVVEALAAAPGNGPTQALDKLAIPASVRLNYDIRGQSRGFNYQATGVMTWQQDGSRYDAKMVVSALLVGSRTLSSTGAVTADGLAPVRFSDKGRSELAAHFDADQGRISFSANTPAVPWQRGAQDRLSVFFQLAGLLAGQPGRFPVGTQIPIFTAGAREADTWTFTVVGEDTLRLPTGEVRALRLMREPRREFDQRVDIWFAPALNYWPVRIMFLHHNGDYADQLMASSQP